MRASVVNERVMNGPCPKSSRVKVKNRKAPRRFGVARIYEVIVMVSEDELIYMTYLGPLSDPLSRLKINLPLSSEDRWPGSRACRLKELEELWCKLAVRHKLTEGKGV